MPNNQLRSASVAVVCFLFLAAPALAYNRSSQTSTAADSNALVHPDSARQLPDGSGDDAIRVSQPGRFDPQAIATLRRTLPTISIVSPQLIRGGQPSAQALSLLKKAGVRTVIDLQTEPAIVKRESSAARRLGLKFVHIPVEYFTPPSEETINYFLTVVARPENQPVYLHCSMGQDRTGAFVGIYRIQHDGWNADQAYREMLRFGFRPAFVKLSNAVFDRAEKLGRPGQRPTAAFIVRDLRERFSTILHRGL
jgi:protein tyrosine/serine phosphatase